MDSAIVWPSTSRNGEASASTIRPTHPYQYLRVCWIAQQRTKIPPKRERGDSTRANGAQMAVAMPVNPPCKEGSIATGTGDDL